MIFPKVRFFCDSSLKAVLSPPRHFQEGCVTIKNYYLCNHRCISNPTENENRKIIFPFSRNGCCIILQDGGRENRHRNLSGTPEDSPRAFILDQDIHDFEQAWIQPQGAK